MHLDENQWQFHGFTTTPDGTEVIINVAAPGVEGSQWVTSRGIKFPGRFRAIESLSPTKDFSEGHTPKFAEYVFSMSESSGPACQFAGVGSFFNEPVLAKDLRHIRIEYVRDALLRYFEASDKKLASLGLSTEPAPVSRALSRNHRAITDTKLKAVAELYNANLGGTPAKAVAEGMGVAPSTADKYVKLARAAGFITEKARAGRRPKQ